MRSTPAGRQRGGPLLWALVGLIILASIAVGWTLLRSKPSARGAAPAVPVTYTTATTRDVPIYQRALGTVQAFNTVAIRGQLDGPLQSISFTEGQEVHEGDTLAVVDPRPFQAALDEAIAKKAQDEAQLVAARKDLDRFSQLVARESATQQSVDQQQGKVGQLKGMVDADQAAVEAAQTQLSYATIKAPIDGRVGFRQVDVGNIIHANDPNPLTVLTQIRPAMVVFTLPEEQLGSVREAMLDRTVTVTALGQDNEHELARGTLTLIDNQIDQATGTIRLKARFDNDDERLWPGEFVHVLVETDIRRNAVTIPAVAVQRGPTGLYVWIVQASNTAVQRPIEATSADDRTTIVTSGISAGERVVTDGQYRLTSGITVDGRASNTAPRKPS